MILGEDNRKAWSELDVLVMQAYEILEAERCPDCGYYTWICQSTDPHVDWKVEEVKACDAKIAVKEFDERRKSKNKDEDDGARGRPIPSIRNDAFPLSDLRQRYYDEKAAD